MFAMAAEPAGSPFVYTDSRLPDGGEVEFVGFADQIDAEGVERLRR